MNLLLQQIQQDREDTDEKRSNKRQKRVEKRDLAFGFKSDNTQDQRRRHTPTLHYTFSHLVITNHKKNRMDDQ